MERDSVDEVFLFFDYDSHQNNAPGCESDALVEAMLLAFDNEHESGKLYISYPMVEALYDYRAGQCQAHSGCFVDNSEIGLDEVSFETYRELVTVDAIFREEKRMRIEDGSVFVLSAFPEFLLDYFGDKFFNSMAPMRHLKFDDCPRGNG